MDRKFGRLSLLFALCLAISAFSACGGTGVPSGESDVSLPTGSFSLPSDTADSTDGPTGTDSSETTDSSGTSDSSASDSSDSSDESEEPEEPDAPGRILVFGKADESAALLSLLAESGKYDAERADIADAAEYGTAEALGAYDEIILNNVAVREMPDGFQEILCSYVYDLGGGLLTAGGRDERGERSGFIRAVRRARVRLPGFRRGKDGEFPLRSVGGLVGGVHGGRRVQKISSQCRRRADFLRTGLRLRTKCAARKMSDKIG